MHRYLPAGVALVATTGCASVAPLDNPLTLRPMAENPAVIAPGVPDPDSYARLYEHVIDVLDDSFELKPTSRYAGYLETLPAIAPGFEQFWKPGSPDNRERLLATLQTIRHTAKVSITAGDRGGYTVYVEVWKELLEQFRPAASQNVAVFQEMTPPDRRNEVVGSQPAVNRNWIPVGRDYAYEQNLLRRIREFQTCAK